MLSQPFSSQAVAQLAGSAAAAHAVDSGADGLAWGGNEKLEPEQAEVCVQRGTGHDWSALPPTLDNAENTAVNVLAHRSSTDSAGQRNQGALPMSQLPICEPTCSLAWQLCAGFHLSTRQCRPPHEFMVQLQGSLVGVEYQPHIQEMGWLKVLWK